MTRVLHHLALERDWRDALSAGEYTTSTRGRTLTEEGFIHACLPEQVDGVARRYYAGETQPLLLLSIEIAALECEVRLEVPPGADEAFPHVYGPIPVSAVSDAVPYRVGGDSS